MHKHKEATPKERLNQYRAIAENAGNGSTWRDHVPKGKRLAVNKPFQHNGYSVLWIENTSDVGLRFVGTAHDVCRMIGSRAVDHAGWFIDEFQEDTYCGVVYQLPARNGRARYVYGRNDPWNDGAALIVLSDVIEGDRGGNDGGADYNALRDAAIRADSFAERDAEEEREYNAAWQAGRLFSNAADDAKALREQVRAAIKEIKTKPEIPPTLCAMLREAIASKLEELDETRATMRKLKEGEGVYSGRELIHAFYAAEKRLREAFNDGAGRAVLKV